MDKMYSEIIDLINNVDSTKDAINVINTHGNYRFLEFLKIALDKDIVFDVDIPNYKPSDSSAGLSYSSLSFETKKLYRFIKNHPDRPSGLTDKVREDLLLILLESLHKEEAELLVRVMKKEFNVKHITLDLVKDMIKLIGH